MLCLVFLCDNNTLRWYLKVLNAFTAGFAAYPRGLVWLWRHKRYLMMSLLPAPIGALVIASALVAAWVHWTHLLMWFGITKTFLGENSGAGASFGADAGEWLRLLVFYARQVVLGLGVVVGAGLGGVIVMAIVASPIYEAISMAVEKECQLGSRESKGIGFWRALWLIKEELKKVLLIVALTVVSLVLPLIMPAFGVLVPILAAFLVACDVVDYPMARRGLHFDQRMAFMRREWRRLLGFGVWLAIPVLNWLTIPLAVAGGTILYWEATDIKS